MAVVEFTSKRKRASIVIRYPENAGTDKEVRVFCKGAPDMLFDLTETILCPGGKTQTLSDSAPAPQELLNPGEAPGTSITNKELLERTVKTFAN